MQVGYSPTIQYMKHDINGGNRLDEILILLAWLILAKICDITGVG
jgi:hypothetical protein